MGDGLCVSLKEAQEHLTKLSTQYNNLEEQILNLAQYNDLEEQILNLAQYNDLEEQILNLGL